MSMLRSLFVFAAAVGADDIAVLHFKGGYPSEQNNLFHQELFLAAHLSDRGLHRVAR